MMTKYRLTLEIDIWAPSQREGAQEAFRRTATMGAILNAMPSQAFAGELPCGTLQGEPFTADTPGWKGFASFDEFEPKIDPLVSALLDEESPK